MNTKFLGWGTGFFDFDNDGWKDIFMTNGHVYPEVDQHTPDIPSSRSDCCTGIFVMEPSWISPGRPDPASPSDILPAELRSATWTTMEVGDRG